MISEKEWLAAEERGNARQAGGLYAVAAAYDTHARTLRITLKKGVTISFPKERAQVMATASDEDLSEVAIKGGGWYIMFPKLDDGLTMDGILAGRLGDLKWEQEWAAANNQVAA